MSRLSYCTHQDEFDDNIQGNIDFFDLKMRTGRTERVKFRITADGRQRQRIFSAIFFAS